MMDDVHVLQRGKRAQTEVLGLAIVIILIMVGILFVVKFGLREQPSQARETFTAAEISSNFANALLETSDTECHGIQIRTLLEDCAKPPQDIDCDGDNRPDSCERSHHIIEHLLNSTLMAWDRPYVFNVTVFPAANIYLYNSMPVTDVFKSPGVWVYPEPEGADPVPGIDFMSRETSLHLISLNPGNIFVRVDLYS